MFEAIVVQENQDYIDFLQLYARFVKDSLDPNADRVRMYKFARRIDEAWAKLPDEKKSILTKVLASRGLLPQEAILAIKYFKASIVSIAEA